MPKNFNTHNLKTQPQNEEATEMLEKDAEQIVSSAKSHGDVIRSINGTVVSEAEYQDWLRDRSR